MRHDVVLAITRGGLVPAGMLAYLLGWRDILVAAVAVYDDHGRPGDAVSSSSRPTSCLRGKRVLIVDEVWDTGTTIAAVVERVRVAGGQPVTGGLLTSRRARRSDPSPTITSCRPTPGSSTRSSTVASTSAAARARLALARRALQLAGPIGELVLGPRVVVGSSGSCGGRSASGTCVRLTRTRYQSDERPRMPSTSTSGSSSAAAASGGATFQRSRPASASSFSSPARSR